MLMNHKRNNKNRTSTINQYDIEHLNVWLRGWRGDPHDRKFYANMNRGKGLAQMPEIFRFSVTRTAAGICLDCERSRCTICNGCKIDIFEGDLDKHACQRCICESYEPEEPLNNAGVSLDELVRHRQGCRKKKGVP